MISIQDPVSLTQSQRVSSINFDVYFNAEENELSEKEKRLAKDYQLQRALDLLKGLSIFEESFEE